MSNEAWANLAFFLVFLALAYLLLIRPTRKRAQEASKLQSSLSVGDEIMLTSGMFGRVESLEGEIVAVEVARGVVVRVHRGAVGRIVTDTPATGDAPATEPGHPDSGEATEGVR